MTSRYMTSEFIDPVLLDQFSGRAVVEIHKTKFTLDNKKANRALYYKIKWTKGPNSGQVNEIISKPLHAANY